MKSTLKQMIVFTACLFLCICFFSSKSYSLNTSYYLRAAQVLREKNVMVGDTKGNLNLDKPLKRSEISKMIVILLGKKKLAEHYLNLRKTSFKDVKTNYWGLGYIEAARSLGILTGYPDGNFRPEQYLKIEELTAIVVRALGFKESDLKGKWPLNYVQKAFDLNLYYNIESDIELGKYVTRGQTAAILYNAFLNSSLKNPTIINVEPIDLTTLKVTFDKELQTINTSDLKLSNNIKILSVNFSDQSKQIIEVKTSPQKENSHYTLYYKDSAFQFISIKLPFVIEDTLKVENLTKMYISFSKQLVNNQKNLDSIKIYVNDKEVTTVKKTLLNNSETVSLEFEQRLNQGDKLKIFIFNLLSTSGQYLTAVKEFTVIDSAKPLVTNVKVIDSKKIRVEFNEPILVTSINSYAVCTLSTVGLNIFIDGNPAYAKINSNQAGKIIEIELFNPLREGNHDLEITQLKDLAGNVLDSYKYTFWVNAEKEPPKVVSVEIKSNRNIVILFNEEIKSTNNVPYGEFEVYQSNDSLNHAINANIRLLSDKKTVEITLAPQLKLDVRALVFVQIRVRNVEDLSGNKLTEWINYTTKANDDTTKPGVKNVSVMNNNSIIIEFTENVDSNNLNNCFSLISLDGSKIIEPFASSVKQYKENIFTSYIVTFNTLSKVNNGKYTLKITDIRDMSVRENSIDTVTFQIEAKDTCPPTIVSAIAKYDPNSDNDKIEISFSEQMDIEKLRDLSLYYVGTNNPNISLSSIRNARIENISPTADKVVIVIPGADDPTPGRWSPAGGIINKIAVPFLRDTSNNLIENASFSQPYTVLFNLKGISPHDIDVSAVDKNTIEIRALNGFSFSYFEPSSIMFRNAIATTPLNGSPDNDKVCGLNITSYSISSDKKVITIKFANSLTSKAHADTNDTDNEPEPLKIFTTNSNIKDQYGFSLEIPPSANLSTYPSIAVKDKIPPVQTGVISGTGPASDLVIFTFDEAIFSINDVTSSVLAAAIELKINDTILIPEVDYIAYIQNNSLVAKIKKPDVIDSKISAVIKRPELFVDESKNIVITLNMQTVEHITERTPPNVTAEYSASDARKVKLVFTEPMDPQTLIPGNFSCTNGGDIIKFEKSVDNKSVEITFTNPLVNGCEINISPNVKDLAGNSVATQVLKK